MQSVHVGLSTWMCALLLLGDHPSSTKLLVLPWIPVPSYLWQPCLSSKTSVFPPPPPPLKLCGSPNWWSIKATVWNDTPPISTWPMLCFALKTFTVLDQCLLKEIYLKSPPLIWLQYRGDTLILLTKLSDVWKRHFNYFFLNNDLCSTSRNNYNSVVSYKLVHSTIKFVFGFYASWGGDEKNGFFLKRCALLYYL